MRTSVIEPSPARAAGANEARTRSRVSPGESSRGVADGAAVAGAEAASVGAGAGARSGEQRHPATAAIAAKLATPERNPDTTRCSTPGDKNVFPTRTSVSVAGRARNCTRVQTGASFRPP